MKTLGTTLLIGAALAAGASIWQPFGGAWWQWGITALLLLFVGAACSGSGSKSRVDRARADAEARAIAYSEELRRRDAERDGRPTYGQKDT